MLTPGETTGQPRIFNANRTKFESGHKIRNTVRIHSSHSTFETFLESSQTSSMTEISVLNMHTRPTSNLENVHIRISKSEPSDVDELHLAKRPLLLFWANPTLHYLRRLKSLPKGKYRLLHPWRPAREDPGLLEDDKDAKSKTKLSVPKDLGTTIKTKSSTKSITRDSPNFREQVLKLRGIVMENGKSTESGRHFGVEKPSGKRTIYYTWKCAAPEASIWLGQDDNFLAKLRNKYSCTTWCKECEAELSAYALSALLKDGEPQQHLSDDSDARTWKMKRTVQEKAKPG